MRITKTIMILVCICTLGSSLLSQKEDFIWVLGYSFEGFPVVKPHGGVDLIFKESGQVDTIYIKRDTRFDHANASICDKEGKMLFYTNGNYVNTRFHEPMANGDGIGKDGFEYGNSIKQGYMALPYPEHDNKYLIVYGKWDNEGSFGFIYSLQYALIDMTEDAGRGEVLEKNVPFFERRLSWGNITACRHANGRDWWVTVPGFKNSTIEVFLLDPNGIRHHSSEVFEGIELNRGGVGSTRFTPDGSKYIYAEGVKINEERFIHVFEFDRCEGSLRHKETFGHDEYSVHFSVVVSSNSQMLYNILAESIYQYDLGANDIASTKLKVAAYDGFIDRVETFFNTSVLGPNGKIYVNTVSSSHYLHVIEQPDVRGEGCDVRQHSFKLPAYNCRTMPNFPDYRLGKLEGSPCDTLISNSTMVFEEGALRVHPNPASDYLVVELPNGIYGGEVDATLTSQQGVKMLSATLSKDSSRIDVSGLPAGVYILIIRTKTGHTAQAKFVIQR